MISMAFSEAKYYVDNLSENVKRGNRQKLRRGDWPNKAPFGYLNNKADKSIYLDNERAKFVTKAFQLFSTGRYTYVNIRSFFIQNKIKNISGVKPHLDKIKRILTDPFYYGYMEFNDELFQGNHQPLISKKLFDKCQKIVKQHSRQTKSIKAEFDFLGLIKCQECGSSITAEKHTKHYLRTNRTATYTYYRCSKKRGKCNQRYISKDEIEAQIRQIIQPVSLPQTAYKKFLEWLEKDRQEAKLKSQGQINNVTRQLKLIEEKLDRLLEAYLDQLIDSQNYQTKKNELIETKADLHENLKDINTIGNTWLEPFSEWVEQAFHACKILRAKNNGHELAFMAKTVSSNLFLQNQKLSVNYASPGWNVFASTRTDAKNYQNNSNLLAVYRKIRTSFQQIVK
ncbi:recombinase zinc beta ribbon domain-containing protein [Patescibacteria group bacterium]|nr:recombinase zinc beta ribbon domain-containing protein [Patescibacteria group bacterium]